MLLIPPRFSFSTTALLVLAYGFDASAAGFDCKAAASASKRTICANTVLRQLDTMLADVYAKALEAAPDLRGNLRQQQQDWLQARDQCGANTQCLTTQYEQRIATLALPDQADMKALEELRQAIETAQRTHPDFPLDNALEGLRIRSKAVSFANEEDKQDPMGFARFPQVQPKGVSNSEWRALQASRIDSDGEKGQANYLLLDLDGDGLRDLIIDSYTGGTGLFRTISVLRQADGKFTVPGRSPGRTSSESVDQPDASYLYALNGRGGNQSADWIRLHGRVYAIYRDSRYGVDNIYLLRPWHSSGRVPRLTIHYRYRLSVSAIQETGGQSATRLEPLLRRALNDAVRLINPAAINETVKRTRPICPVPANVSDEVREANLGYGPGHYTFEIVADVPVQVKNQCYIGQLRDWFGAYTPMEGLQAELCMRRPEELWPSKEDCYAVQGPRAVLNIDTGMAPFEN
jgi:uncharacterized protein